MVGKLRAAMDAKQALDPDFVIMARCDLGGVPSASFAEIIERCQAYKAEAQVDVVCPNGLRSWEEIQEAIRLIPRYLCLVNDCGTLRSCSQLKCERCLCYVHSRHRFSKKSCDQAGCVGCHFFDATDAVCANTSNRLQQAHFS
jgi:hypothetical protein